MIEEKSLQVNKRRIPARLPRGYSFPPSLKPELWKLCQTSLLMSSATALVDWLCLGLCVFAGTLFVNSFGWVWSIPIHLFLLWPLCGRSQRGLENLTHEASHHNFDRSSPFVNDGAANWLCAFWVLISVDIFKRPHSIHHKQFGSANDPDKQRFGSLGTDSIPQPRRQLLRYLLRVMPRYVSGYWKQYSDKKAQLLRSLSLHLLLATLLSIVWWEYFWLLWLVYFWVPFLFYLPVHRFLAEAEEHRYLSAETEFDATFSNVGRFQRWFLHPHGDGYHLLHHLLPQIPHWRMADAHQCIMATDPTYPGGHYRTVMLRSPKTWRQ